MSILKYDLEIIARDLKSYLMSLNWKLCLLHLLLILYKEDLMAIFEIQNSRLICNLSLYQPLVSFCYPCFYLVTVGFYIYFLMKLCGKVNIKSCRKKMIAGRKQGLCYIDIHYDMYILLYMLFSEK